MEEDYQALPPSDQEARTNGEGADGGSPPSSLPASKPTKLPLINVFMVPVILYASGIFMVSVCIPQILTDRAMGDDDTKTDDELEADAQDTVSESDGGLDLRSQTSYAVSLSVTMTPLLLLHPFQLVPLAKPLPTYYLKCLKFNRSNK